MTEYEVLREEIDDLRLGWTLSESMDHRGLYDVYGPSEAEGPRMVLSRDINTDGVRRLIPLGRVGSGAIAQQGWTAGAARILEREMQV